MAEAVLTAPYHFNGKGNLLYPKNQSPKYRHIQTAMTNNLFDYVHILCT